MTEERAIHLSREECDLICRALMERRHWLMDKIASHLYVEGARKRMASEYQDIRVLESKLLAPFLT